MSFGGGGGQIVGFEYNLGMHIVLCYGPCDAIANVRMGDRQVFSGTGVHDDTINISIPSLWGGDRREGGVKGDMRVQMGIATQTKDPYLIAQLADPDIPSFRGVMSLIFKEFYFGNNPYIKNMDFLVDRTDVLTNGLPQWNITKAKINDGLNPAHIIRECLTNDEWGMGYTSANIDDANFTATADTLFNEGFGLNFLWSNSQSIQDFISLVERHIHGRVSGDPSTGLFRIKLIRDDIVPASLTLFDESNVLKLDSFQRKGYAETVNEVSIVYRDNSTIDGEKDKTVTAQDLANIQVQGAVINGTILMHGIAQADLAARVAIRELKLLSTPLSRVTITVNRDAWDFIIGDAVKFSWSKLGIVETVYRIIGHTSGDLLDNKIRLELLEDVFGLDSTAYITPQPSAWVDPRTAPAVAAAERLIEATYWDVIRNTPQADVAAFDPDAGFLTAAAVRASGDSFFFELHTRIGTAAFVKVDDGAFCSSCTLVNPITSADINIDYENDQDVSQIKLDSYAYIEDEIVIIKSVDEVNFTMVIERGILDTVPAPHAIGARLWAVDNNRFGYDQTEYVASETVDAKILPSTPLGTLDINVAAQLQLTLNNRFQRPYPPANMSVNGIFYPVASSDAQAFSWLHRDKTMQTVILINQFAGSIGPEPGTVYELKIYDENLVLVRTEVGLTGLSFAWTQEATDAPQTDPISGNRPNDLIKIELKATLGAHDSWQTNQHTYDRAGWGQRFDQYYGGP